MKTFLSAILLLVFFIPCTSKAQLYKVELDDKVKNASLIVEGEVIGQKCIWNPKHTMIYTANTIKVYKIFKGQIADKVVEIATTGGSIDNIAIQATNQLNLHKGDVGIFFCTPRIYELISPNTNRTLLKVYSEEQGFLQYNLDEDIAVTPFVEYKGIQSTLYNIIENKTGKNLQVIDPSFDNTFAKGSGSASGQGTPGVQATITSFSPSTVHAGALNDAVNNLLTITGSGFGSTPSGQCAVRFAFNGKLNTDVAIPYNYSNIVSWSDTQIKIRVPSDAGTGYVKVITSTGSTAKSASQLNVDYSVLNAGYANAVINNVTYPVLNMEVGMMNANNNGGYTIYYSTSTAGGGKNFDTSPEKATFQRALTTWKGMVGANIIEGGTTTTQVVSIAQGTAKVGDGKCVVMFDNTNTGEDPLGDGVLASTFNKFLGCPHGFFAAQKTEFDVVLRNQGVSVGTYTFTTGPCFPGTSSSTQEEDLELVLLHELGHALNLGHILDAEQQAGAQNNYMLTNPAKLMHPYVLPSVVRRSLDYASYYGALYTVSKKNLNYGTGTCSGLLSSEMTPLSKTAVSNDDCPSTFPTTTTPAGSSINFDLAHTTSNKYVDPQFTAVNCGSANGEQVTNNAFFALRTGTTNSGTLTINISNYATTPSTQSSCTDQGVRLALYDVGSCPTGQAYPQPYACRTFTTNGSVSSITGLSSNHNYLLYVDGLRNTKASFTMTLNGTALPIVLTAFTGEYTHGVNLLHIDVQEALNIKSVAVEKSADGISFSGIGLLPYSGNALLGNHDFTDALPFTGNNYYRLKVTDLDGSVQYSNIILLSNDAKTLVNIYPNPVKDLLNIQVTAAQENTYQYFVFDMNGKLLVTQKTSIGGGMQKITIPVQRFAAGAYYIKIQDASGNVLLKQQFQKQ